MHYGTGMPRTHPDVALRCQQEIFYRHSPLLPGRQGAVNFFDRKRDKAACARSASSGPPRACKAVELKQAFNERANFVGSRLFKFGLALDRNNRRRTLAGTLAEPAAEQRGQRVSDIGGLRPQIVQRKHAVARRRSHKIDQVVQQFSQAAKADIAVGDRALLKQDARQSLGSAP